MPVFSSPFISSLLMLSIALSFSWALSIYSIPLQDFSIVPAIAIFAIFVFLALTFKFTVGTFLLFDHHWNLKVKASSSVNHLCFVCLFQIILIIKKLEDLDWLPTFKIQDVTFYLLSQSLLDADRLEFHLFLSFY